VSVSTARKGTYETSPVKRKKRRFRRTQADLASLKAALAEIVNSYRCATVRQIFYQAVTKSIIEKTEKGYKLVCRLLLEMRRDGDIPHWKIADNTRVMRKPKTYSGLAGMLENVRETYRRSIWADEDCYCEIWTEKDALSGVLWDVTWQWDVPLMISRGFASESFLYSAATAIEAQGKPTFIYYFGDRDPSGVLIDKSIEHGLRRLAPNCDIEFKRVAVTDEQIEQYSLPTRPTKLSGNKHAKNFEGDSVEVDAIAPDELQRIATDCIIQHIDGDRYDRLMKVEEAERETLREIAERLEAK